MKQNVDTEVWQSLGGQDPDWAVATHRERKHGGWAGYEEEFYESGRLSVMKALDIVPEVPRGKAIDWGSGTGRLSFALAQEFERVTCVDISTSMQAVLAERAEDRGVSNLDLTLVEDFVGGADHDFGLSLITMQHFADLEVVRSAIESMVESLKPGGQMIIEIPAGAHTLRSRVEPRLRLYRVLRRLGFKPKTLHARGLSGIKMLCIPKDWVVDVCDSAGATVIRTAEYRGGSHQMVWYVIRRAHGA